MFFTLTEDLIRISSARKIEGDNMGPTARLVC